MDDIKSQIIAIGKAMLDLGLQNTHSGNISVRVKDKMYITKSGSMKGHLSEEDIVDLGLNQPLSGLSQASTETPTHRKILQYAGSAIHAHSIPATLMSFITKELIPVDILGKRFLKKVPVVKFKYPVGSKEMAAKIPDILKKYPAMIVKTHGPMVRGADVFETFFLLNIVDHSAEILLNLQMLGIKEDMLPVLKYPDLYDYSVPKGPVAKEDKLIIDQLNTVAADIFKLKISPFHTGSVSIMDGREMLFSQGISAPKAFNRDLFRVDLDRQSREYYTGLHLAVYRYSHSRAAIFSHSPQVMIQAFKSINSGSDRIVSVDAEGIHLYPVLPVVYPDEDLKVIIKKADKYKMVAIAGLGVLAIGNTPGHCIHHNSSAENICRYKTGLNVMERLGIGN